MTSWSIVSRYDGNVKIGKIFLRGFQRKVNIVNGLIYGKVEVIQFTAKSNDKP